VDLGSVRLDGEQHWFVAHLVVRGATWWRGRVLAVMNAQWYGRWDVAPKSHPNDGLLDTFDSDLRFDDRLKARRRLPTGTHVPHPGIAQQRVRTATFELARPGRVELDGVDVGRVRTLEVSVEPDALTCVV
jgi:diacylglycerol kinase family enzyme